MVTTLEGGPFPLVTSLEPEPLEEFAVRRSSEWFVATPDFSLRFPDVM